MTRGEARKAGIAEDRILTKEQAEAEGIAVADVTAEGQTLDDTAAANGTNTTDNKQN